MQKKEEILENFKTAIRSTIKSISDKEDIEISFGGQDILSENNKLKLPEINEFQNKINFDLTRAIADSESLKLKYRILIFWLNLSLHKTLNGDLLLYFL